MRKSKIEQEKSRKSEIHRGRERVKNRVSESKKASENEWKKQIVRQGEKERVQSLVWHLEHQNPPTPPYFDFFF